MKAWTGCESGQNHSEITDPTTFATAVNAFYKWFDGHKRYSVCVELLGALHFHEPASPLLHTGGCPAAKVLKLFAMEFSPSLHSLLENGISTPNTTYYRPFALTTIIMYCLENLSVITVLPEDKPHQTPNSCLLGQTREGKCCGTPPPLSPPAAGITMKLCYNPLWL